MQDLNDIFSTWPDACPGGVQSPTGSPRRNDSMSQQGSPSCNIEGNMDQQGNFPCNVPSRVSFGDFFEFFLSLCAEI